MPKVSVVLPTYNNETYLKDAIDSIIQQTFTDFELIIVDDGSTDKTHSILSAYNDPRMVIITNQENMGVPSSVNRGLEKAQGEYVARMDGDDVSSLNRFALQVSFLDDHPHIGVVGGQRQYIDETGKLYDCPIRVALVHNLIVWRVFLGAPFWHPSTMIRKKLFDDYGFYNTNFYYGSDLELWLRLLTKTQFANLDEDILLYRVHAQAVTHRWKEMPQSPPIRSQVSSQFIGRSIHESIFDFINTAMYSNARLSDEKATEIISFLFDLYNSLITRNIFIPEQINCVHNDLVQRVMVMSRRSPLTLSEVVKVNAPSFYPGWLRNLFAFRSERKIPPAMRKRAHDLKQGYKGAFQSQRETDSSKP